MIEIGVLFSGIDAGDNFCVATGDNNRGDGAGGTDVCDPHRVRLLEHRDEVRGGGRDRGPAEHGLQLPADAAAAGQTAKHPGLLHLARSRRQQRLPRQRDHPRRPQRQREREPERERGRELGRNAAGGVELEPGPAGDDREREHRCGEDYNGGRERAEHRQLAAADHLESLPLREHRHRIGLGQHPGNDQRRQHQRAQRPQHLALPRRQQLHLAAAEHAHRCLAGHHRLRGHRVHPLQPQCHCAVLQDQRRAGAWRDHPVQQHQLHLGQLQLRLRLDVKRRLLRRCDPVLPLPQPLLPLHQQGTLPLHRLRRLWLQLPAEWPRGRRRHRLPLLQNGYPDRLLSDPGQRGRRRPPRQPQRGLGRDCLHHRAHDHGPGEQQHLCERGEQLQQQGRRRGRAGEDLVRGGDARGGLLAVDQHQPGLPREQSRDRDRVERHLLRAAVRGRPHGLLPRLRALQRGHLQHPRRPGLQGLPALRAARHRRGLREQVADLQLLLGEEGVGRAGAVLAGRDQRAEHGDLSGGAGGVHDHRGGAKAEDQEGEAALGRGVPPRGRAEGHREGQDPRPRAPQVQGHQALRAHVPRPQDQLLRLQLRNLPLGPPRHRPRRGAPLRPPTGLQQLRRKLQPGGALEPVGVLAGDAVIGGVPVVLVLPRPREEAEVQAAARAVGERDRLQPDQQLRLRGPQHRDCQVLEEQGLHQLLPRLLRLRTRRPQVLHAGLALHPLPLGRGQLPPPLLPRGGRHLLPAHVLRGQPRVPARAGGAGREAAALQQHGEPEEEAEEQLRAQSLPAQAQHPRLHARPLRAQQGHPPGPLGPRRVRREVEPGVLQQGRRPARPRHLHVPPHEQDHHRQPDPHPHQKGQTALRSLHPRQDRGDRRLGGVEHQDRPLRLQPRAGAAERGGDEAVSTGGERAADVDRRPGGDIHEVAAGVSEQQGEEEGAPASGSGVGEGDRARAVLHDEPQEQQVRRVHDKVPAELLYPAADDAGVHLVNPHRDPLRAGESADALRGHHLVRERLLRLRQALPHLQRHDLPQRDRHSRHLLQHRNRPPRPQPQQHRDARHQERYLLADQRLHRHLHDVPRQSGHHAEQEAEPQEGGRRAAAQVRVILIVFSIGLLRVASSEYGYQVREQITSCKLVKISSFLPSSPTQSSLTRVSLIGAGAAVLAFLGKVVKPDVKTQFLLPRTVLLFPMMRLLLPATPLELPRMTLLQGSSCQLSTCSFQFTRSVFLLMFNRFSEGFPQFLIRSNSQMFRATCARSKESWSTGTPGIKIRAERQLWIRKARASIIFRFIQKNYDFYSKNAIKKGQDPKNQYEYRIKKRDSPGETKDMRRTIKQIKYIHHHFVKYEESILSMNPLMSFQYIQQFQIIIFFKDQNSTFMLVSNLLYFNLQPIVKAIQSFTNPYPQKEQLGTIQFLFNLWKYLRLQCFFENIISCQIGLIIQQSISFTQVLITTGFIVFIFFAFYLSLKWLF